jgi:hypothetical protein
MHGDGDYGSAQRCEEHVMRLPSSILTVRSLTAIGLVATALTAGTIAYGELQDFDGIQGREYHARMYEKGRCKTCHGTDTPSGYPEDGACLKCHDAADLAEATARESEEESGQNPHDSLHYGQDVPCVECHGEHSSKKPLCADCHNFDYPNHQE